MVYSFVISQLEFYPSSADLFFSRHALETLVPNVTLFVNITLSSKVCKQISNKE